MTSAFLLAAPHSGSGKTTCTLTGTIHLHFDSCPAFPLGLFGLTPPE